MGLPLFVTKVESDLPGKPCRKHDVLAPTNSGVQSTRSRNRRVHIGDTDMSIHQARWQAERTRWREHQRAIESARARGGNTLLGDSIQVLAVPSPPTQAELGESDHRTTNLENDVVDMAMDEFLRLDRLTRAPFVERLRDLLGHRWTLEGLRARARILELRNEQIHGPSLIEDPGLSLNTWETGTRSQARRARVASPADTGEDASSIGDNARLLSTIQAMRRAGRLPLERRPTWFRPPSQRVLDEIHERQRVIDGLGDRRRSMSPEVWDTLLATMTPDPEPPSGSSSFASFPTSQSHQTNASSFTATDAAPRETDGFLSEPPCDSGCENSDPEEAGPSDGARNERDERRRMPSFRRRSRNAERRSGQASAPETTVPGGTNPSSVTVAPGGARSHIFRVGWVGQLSVGATDESRTQDDTSQVPEAQAPRTHNEDDWSGMQLIVRSLARREDIPDEWWLEAGLSRTLGDDAGM